jgi:hypothetical protein
MLHMLETLGTALPPCISNICESYLPPIYFTSLDDNIKCTADHCWCVNAIEEGWTQLVQCELNKICTN